MTCHWQEPNTPGLGKQMVKDRYPILLIIAYVLSRLYWWGRGITFDGYGIGGMGEPTHLMQAYPFELMRSPLWLETLWYGHAQPPLFSLFLKICQFQPMIVHIVYLFMGLAVVIAIRSILLTLHTGDIVAFLAALLWIFLPSTILYESMIFYTHAVVCLLILSAWALQRNHLLLFSALVCTIILTRSLFHPFLFGLPVLLIGSWRK